MPRTIFHSSGQHLQPRSAEELSVLRYGDDAAPDAGWYTSKAFESSWGRETLLKGWKISLTEFNAFETEAVDLLLEESRYAISWKHPPLAIGYLNHVISILTANYEWFMKASIPYGFRTRSLHGYVRRLYEEIKNDDNLKNGEPLTRRGLIDPNPQPMQARKKKLSKLQDCRLVVIFPGATEVKSAIQDTFTSPRSQLFTLKGKIRKTCFTMQWITNFLSRATGSPGFSPAADALFWNSSLTGNFRTSAASNEMHNNRTLGMAIRLQHRNGQKSIYIHTKPRS